jgi:hypothetical protein
MKTSVLVCTAFVFACAADPDGSRAIADANPPTAANPDSRVERPSDAMSAQRDTAPGDVVAAPVPDDSAAPDARVAAPDLAVSVDASPPADALPIPTPDARTDTCVCQDAGRQLYDGSMCPTSEYFMACICEQFVMHCEFVVDPGCPGSFCGDDVELTCCGVPPICPDGEVVTRRNGCWACVTEAECEA